MKQNSTTKRSRDRQGVPMALPAAKCDEDATPAINGINEPWRVFNAAGALVGRPFRAASRHSCRLSGATFNGGCASAFVGNKEGHRLALPGDNVFDGVLFVLTLPQPARAAVARPTPATRLVATQAAQRRASALRSRRR